jgi:hypothetical protein
MLRMNTRCDAYNKITLAAWFVYFCHTLEGFRVPLKHLNGKERVYGCCGL